MFSGEDRAARNRGSNRAADQVDFADRPGVAPGKVPKGHGPGLAPVQRQARADNGQGRAIQAQLTDDASVAPASINQSVAVDLSDPGAVTARIDELLTAGAAGSVPQEQLQEITLILQGTEKSVRKAVLIGLRMSGRLDVLVRSAPPELVPLFDELLAREPQDDAETPIEEQLEHTDNPERAQQALADLRIYQFIDWNDPPRLSDGIVELLAFGVARRTAAGDIGQEGLIGIEQAGRAAQALVLMPLPLYLSVVSQLAMAGGSAPADACSDADPRVESVLVLKAVAARLSEFAAGQDKAADDVGQYGDAIRGDDAEQVKQQSTVRDYGGSDGLQQKFTMTCGPTSIQIVHGEMDPIFAREVALSAKHDLNYETDVGKQQHDYLSKDVVPRVVADDYPRFNTAMTAVAPADAPKAAALQMWIAGLPSAAGPLADGMKLANANGFSNKRLNEFRTYYSYLSAGGSPGWGNSEFATKANAELSQPSGGKFDERAIPPNYQNIAGSMTPISTMVKADCDAMWNKLFRGVDVPMGIMWSGGGGHFMVFTDCRTQGAGAAATREFLLTDPWTGQSAWITEANVLAGNVSPFGTGAIDSLYL